MTINNIILGIGVFLLYVGLNAIYQELQRIHKTIQTQNELFNKYLSKQEREESSHEQKY